MKDKIIFNDNLTIKSYDNGVITEYPCDFYNKYVTTIEKMAKKDQWKYQGVGANFRGDFYEPEKISLKNSYFNSIDAFKDNKVLFSVTINDVSGIFIKDLSADKDSEAHVIHSQEQSYSGSAPDLTFSKIATSIKEDYYTSHLALFNLESNDFTSLTAGDCYDFDSTFSNKSPDDILFATKGVGRDSDGDFVTYSPSSICRYNLNLMEVEEVISEDKFSFVKPKEDSNGNLYYVKRPSNTEKRGGGHIIIDILLIPYRILEAIITFIETFIMMFTGKGFSKNSKSKSSTKTANKRPDELFIEGNLINVDKEYKNNLKHKDAYAGYAPRSWQLIKRSDNNQTVIANGVIDYDLASDGNIVYTNGKHVILVTADGKTEKLADATTCTHVTCLK